MVGTLPKYSVILRNRAGNQSANTVAENAWVKKDT